MSRLMQGFMQGLVVAALLTGSAQAAELVQPEELRRTFFDGKPVNTTSAKGRSTELVFMPDGKVERKGGNRRGREGTWRLSETGFCMKMGSSTREGCYVALRDGGSLKVIRVYSTEFTWSR